jgi:hypothetical protein
MALSATLSKATLAYIHKALHLQSPTVLCDMPTDRPNITLFTAPIRGGKIKSMQPLLALVPEEAQTWDPDNSEEEDWSPLEIAKTLVFIDDKNACCTLTTLLINRFPEHLRRSEGRLVICEYHSTMSQKALDRNLQLLRNGICRIMVCTDAVGMGLDVPDIVRVIQWGVAPWLSLSGWWQRAGRAVRDPTLQGVAAIYYEPKFELAPDSPLCGRTDDEEDMGRIHQFMKDLPAEDDDDTDKAEAGTRRKKKGNLPCEAHLLWYLNTKGCLREVAMHYLSSRPEPRPAFNAEEMGYPCCCRCYKDSTYDPDNFEGFPVRTCTPFIDADTDVTACADVEPDPDADADGDVGDNLDPNQQSQDMAKVIAKSKHRIQLAVRLALQVWREQMLPKHQKSDSMLRAKHILSDSMIAKLEAKCLLIREPVDVVSVISGPGRDIVQYTNLAEHTSDIVEVIQHVISCATAPSIARPARHRAPYLPAPPKPLYSDNEIDHAFSPACANMMRVANKQLRKFDLMEVNVKETARQKRTEAQRLRKLIFGGSQASEAPDESGTDYSQSDAASVAGSVFSTQQTDRELMPPPSIPIKRRRGRPPKPKSQYMSSIAPSEVSVGSSVDSEDTLISDSGRPPNKRPTRESESNALPDNALPVRPRRGRPPGSKNRPKPKDSDAPESQPVPTETIQTDAEPTGTNQTDAEPSQPDVAVPPVRRGRGRPRGSKNKPKP